MAQMDPTDVQPFLEALNEMGEFFSDELSELRQRSYWRLMEDKCSLAEWRYACTQAMARETFHKVPLPAQLLDYVQEYRAAQREEGNRQRRMALEEQRLTIEATQRAIMADPTWHAEQERCWQEAQESLNKLFGANWRTVTDMQAAAERAERAYRIRRALREEDEREDTTDAAN